MAILSFEDQEVKFLQSSGAPNANISGTDKKIILVEESAKVWGNEIFNKIKICSKCLKI